MIRFASVFTLMRLSFFSPFTMKYTLKSESLLPSKMF